MAGLLSHASLHGPTHRTQSGSSSFGGWPPPDPRKAGRISVVRRSSAPPGVFLFARPLTATTTTTATTTPSDGRTAPTVADSAGTGQWHVLAGGPPYGLGDTAAEPASAVAGQGDRRFNLSTSLRPRFAVQVQKARAILRHGLSRCRMGPPRQLPGPVPQRFLHLDRKRLRRAFTCPVPAETAWCPTGHARATAPTTARGLARCGLRPHPPSRPGPTPRLRRVGTTSPGKGPPNVPVALAAVRTPLATARPARTAEAPHGKTPYFTVLT